MYNKSKIQMVSENIEYINKMKSDIKNFLNKYYIKDSIFIYDKREIIECECGYFEPMMETDNMDELLNNVNGYAFRVTGDKYQIGNIYKHLTEAKNLNKVFGINVNNR